jgi:hypothetical protein
VSRFEGNLRDGLPHLKWDIEQENEGCNPQKTNGKLSHVQKMSSFCKKGLAAFGPKP